MTNEGQMASGGLNTMTKVVTLTLAIATPLLTYVQYKQNQDFEQKQIQIEDTQQKLAHQLKVDKQRLESQVAQSQFVDQLLTRIEKYLDKLGTLQDEKNAAQEHRDTIDDRTGLSGLDEKDKLRIMISLSKIAVESHLERKQGGETEAQKALLREIPLRFALLAEDVSMLVSMSKSEAAIQPWADFAEDAASSTIKTTAAKALGRIALTTDSSELQLRKNILKRLIKLARDATELERARDNDAAVSLARVYASFKDEGADASDETKKEMASEMKQAELILGGTGLIQLAYMEVPEVLASTQVTEEHRADGQTGEPDAPPVQSAAPPAIEITQEGEIDSEEIRILIEQLNRKHRGQVFILDR